MDPLSLTASIIAVIGAADSIGKGLSRIIALKGLPDIILALNNEVSELRLVLQELDSLMYRREQSSASREYLQSSLLPNVLRAKDKLRALESLLDNRLRKIDGGVDKIAWLRVEERVLKIQRELRETRLNINTALSILDSSAISRLEARLDTLQLVTQQGHVLMSHNMSQHNSSLEQAMMEMIEVQKRTDIRLGAIEAHTMSSSTPEVTALRKYPEDGSSRRASATLTMEKHSHVQSLEFSALKMKFLRKRDCSPYCDCACHTKTRHNTPRMLQSIVGTLFIGYTGIPALTPKCTNRRCGRNTEGCLQINYYFPQWMVSRVLSAAVRFTQFKGPELSIRILNVRHEKELIFMSAIEGDAATVHKLLSEGQASVLDIASGTGHTALHLAVLRSHVNVVSILLQFGADPLLENSSQETPYDMAWSTILCFEDTRNSATFRVPEIKNLFPSTSALEERRTFSRIHQIVLKLLPADLEKELCRDAAQIDLPDADGRTPLHWAAGRGDTKAVRILLDNGADPDRPDRIGQGPLRSAMKASDPECMKALLYSGARVMQQDHWDQTCLQAAMYYNDPVAFAIPLIDAGIDINAKDCIGTFALLEAVRMGHIDAVVMLIDRGADVNLSDQSGITPFLAAVDSNSHAMVRVLLHTGFVDTSARDAAKQNVLHISAAKSDLDMLMLLIAAHITGVHVNDLREDGLSGIEIAEKRREAELQEKAAEEKVEVDETWIIAYGKLLESVIAHVDSPPPYKDEEDQFTDYCTGTESAASSVYIDAIQYMSLST